MAGDVMSETRKINSDIRSYVSKGKMVKIEGLNGQNSIAVGLTQGKTRISGVAGDRFGAFNSGGRLTMDGPCGRFTGDSMSGGEIAVTGHVASAAGVYMSGGTLVVKGNAGDRIGLNMRGGICVIDGYAGSFVGEYMQGGTLIVTGNVGANLGQWMIGGEMFLGGTVTNMGKNAVMADASPDETAAVVKFLKANGIESVTALRKVVPITPRPFFEAEEAFADTDLESEPGRRDGARGEAIDVESVEAAPAAAPGRVQAATVRIEAAPADEDDQIGRTTDLEEKLAEIRRRREKLMASMKKTKEAR